MMEDIGVVRRRLFIPVDHEWNGVVRDITAQCEVEGMLVPEGQVLEMLAEFYKNRARLALLRSNFRGEI